MHPKISSRAALLGILLAHTGCEEDYRYIDPRMIDAPRATALRFVVVEAIPHGYERPGSDLAPRTTAVPFEQVHLETSIVDANGPYTATEIAEQVAPIWLACLGSPRPTTLSPEHPLDCFVRGRPTSVGATPRCRTPSISEIQADGVPSLDGICRIEPGVDARVTVPLAQEFLTDGFMAMAMIGGAAGVSSETCANRFLSGHQVPTACIAAHGRLRLGPKDMLGDILATHGLSELGLGDSESAEQWPPDRHVRIRSFRVVEIELDGGRERSTTQGTAEAVEIDVPPGGLFEVNRNMGYTVHPEIDPRDAQVHHNGRDQEQLRVAWYYTRGSGRPSYVSDRNADLLDLDWSPGDSFLEQRAVAPVERRAHIHVVVHDDRQGVGWASLAPSIMGPIP
ncbi:MAG: hypothetical protein V3V08_18420 [Nannocystaceae bacterium]